VIFIDMRDAGVVSLYRSLLKAAKIYPSVKRKVFYQEIQLAFREKQHLTDPKAVQEARKMGEDTLKDMSRFLKLGKTDAEWVIDLP